MSESELTKYNQKYFLTGGAANTKVTYLLAVARRKGLRLLRLQHGGYYGYYKNQKWSPHYENCDRYFTWGWECYFNVENLGVEFTPFISPWLSERKKYWMHYNSKLVKNKPNNYDVLIAPTRLAPYISVSGVNTCDEIITRASDLIDIVRELVDDELKVLYKPPSIISSRSYKRALDRMSELGKNNFEVIKKIDKGLTVELFDDVSIVLWDTLGTGFLECVACGIPTIVYLPSYTLFEDNIRHLLTKLEEVHVVHTTPKSIPYTIKKFNKNPMDWMRQSERHKVLQQFSKAFCRTSNNWDEYLMASVKSKQI